MEPLALPACASGRRMGWLEAWKLGQGWGLWLGLAVNLTCLPVLVASILVSFLPTSEQESIPGVVALNLVLAVLWVLGMFVALVATAYLFKCLTSTIDPSVFD